MAAAQPAPALAQAGEAAYLRSAAIHYGQTPGEVAILAEGQVQAEEVPVALTIARHAGVSAEAVLALRRSGRAWADLLVRYGMHAGRIHVPLHQPPTEGPGGEAYAAFAERDPSAWRVIRLSDEAVIFLVNLEFLAEHLELPPQRVADVLVAEGSALRAHGVLLRARTP